MLFFPWDFAWICRLSLLFRPLTVGITHPILQLYFKIVDILFIWTEQHNSFRSEGVILRCLVLWQKSCVPRAAWVYLMDLYILLIYQMLYLYWKCIGILRIASPSWQSTQTFEKCSVSPVLHQNSLNFSCRWLSDHFILGWDSNFTRRRTNFFTKIRLLMQLSFKMCFFCCKKKLDTTQTEG